LIQPERDFAPVKLIRSIAKQVLPANVVEALRKPVKPTLFLAGEPGIPDLPSGVWDSPEWLGYSLSKIESANAGTATYEHDYVDRLACAIGAFGKRHIRVVDWAGGTGFMYFLVREKLPATTKLEWIVADNSALASVGKSQLAPELQFDEHAQSADILLINSSLQYVNDLKPLSDLLQYSFGMIAMTRLLTHEQTVHARQIMFDRYAENCMFHSQDGIGKIMQAAAYYLAFLSENYADSRYLKQAFSPTLATTLPGQTSADWYWKRS
jgi:putative methyltransferase (TIGR04325 family)